MFAPTAQTTSSVSSKEKIYALFAFSFAEAGAKEKAINKKTPMQDFALCGARQELRALDCASL